MKRIVWLLAPAACVLLLSSVMWRSRSTGYKRFVSPPLKDGTRYTFLYPERYSIASTSGGGVSMHDNRPLTPSQSLPQRLGLYAQASLIGLFPGDLRVGVSPQDGTPKDSRSSLGTSTLRFTYINDARSKLFFDICHSNYTREAEPFESKLVSRSFRILPPGAPIPAP